MTRFCKTGLLALTVASCSDPTDPPPGNQPPPPSSPGRPTLRIVSGADASDTIQATLANELVVEYRNAEGNPQAGASVTFFAPNGPRVWIAPSGSSQPSFLVTGTTDSAGRASVRVIFGQVATSGQVVARVATDSTIRVTAAYTVLPGATTRMRVTPRDTTLSRGKSYVVRATAEDRHGNTRADVMRFTAATPALVRVDASGSVETIAIGRARVQVAAGSYTDSVFVSIPPEGVIAAMRLIYSASGIVRIVTMNLDGSGETTRVNADAQTGAGFAWNPAGDALVFAVGAYDMNLFQQTATAVAPFFKAPPFLQSMAFPRFSRDGAWVYFNGRPAHQNGEIWRARSDGTGLEQVGPTADYYAIDANPDPSPDGTRVVYSTSRVDVTMPMLRMLTLNPRVNRELGVPGVTPRWLPDGSAVVYVTTKPGWGYLSSHSRLTSFGFLSLMNPDGSNPRIIPTGTKQWYPHFDISPDGKYILAMSEARIFELVEIATGAAIPLTWSSDLYFAMWKP